MIGLDIFIFVTNRVSIFLGAIFLFTVSQMAAQDREGVELSWLGDSSPEISTGVSWGVPFPEGEVKSINQFELINKEGDQLPLQSWNLAYWPDGTLKWLGFATVVETGDGSGFTLMSTDRGAKSTTKSNLIVKENADSIQIDTGVLQCRIPKRGSQIFSDLRIGNEVISSAAQLVCINQNGPEKELGEQPIKEEFKGEISKVTLEQNGPVRAVVKIEGRHVTADGSRSWLPFVVRLYFYADLQSVKLVHTIIYDGHQDKDFIRGLGVTFDLPMDEEVYNRHIRFSGEKSGFWDEPAQPLVGRVPFSTTKENTYESQLKGQRIAEQSDLTKEQVFLVENLASWNDFKLVQDNSEGFRIQKRTGSEVAWIDAGVSNRSEGMAFAGDVSGGLAVTIRDFWQSYPASLEVRNMRKDTAQIKAWLWSPDGPAMDMRHYDTIPWGHTLKASYEDVQPGFSTPEGVARTSEILLFATSGVPSLDKLNEITSLGNTPPLLIASPEYIHKIPVFGIWSLPDRSTVGKAWVEDQLESAFEYYQKEVYQRDWYGFWDYGDVMHAYDEDRREWKYDVGGYAWDNTELMPHMWLWYYYLRTGKEDVFRMAEAMTRHTSEVDVHHIGKFAGLGSRHNVRHWGDGSKEVRVSQAAPGRFYYYLTTDERIGDLMRESVEASNKAIGDLDPLRLILDKSEYPTHARVGPDWFALVGNWMTEWERTGDPKYRDKILTGVESFSEMPYGFFSGKAGAFGYDPESAKMYQLQTDHIGSSHLSVLMGGPEIAYELTQLLDSQQWDRLWLQFAKIYGASSEIVEEEFGVRTSLGNPGPWYARLPAYYAKVKGDKHYAARAWEDFLGRSEYNILTNFKMEKYEGNETLEPVYEVPGVSTNNTAQWSLNAIQLLELIGDDLPESHPRFKDNN
ncbi:hypothetical protein LB465_04665 [Salegentibacter sp. LM13S]|uniref:exo-rhamnogalacturonan lyase family protein n=1 Tax=Salegentibacter lacus TaxID=2873599 RepID=UPI001CCAA152|nr:hypothetical protein [Salegentibacter lacus]MBZ9630063.1 hypothetical protein [Salegentibacter lacus]